MKTMLRIKTSDTIAYFRPRKDNLKILKIKKSIKTFIIATEVNKIVV
jgi:hypothetical protein